MSISNSLLPKQFYGNRRLNVLKNPHYSKTHAVSPMKFSPYHRLCNGAVSSVSVNIAQLLLMELDLKFSYNFGIRFVTLQWSCFCFFCSLPFHVNLILLSFTGDILIALLSMPTEVFWDFFGGWIFGNFACKSLTYVQFILFATTAHVHMCISYDRYEAICTPVSVPRRMFRIYGMIAASWTLAVAVAIPQLFIFLVEVSNNNNLQRMIVQI